MSEKEKLLKIQDLSVEYDTEISTVYAVNGLDMELGYGETLGLVGETGAGKTSTALSIIQLLPEGIGFVTSGSIQLDGVDMLNTPEETIRKMRGSTVSMIFQDPMSALNPVMTVGAQIMEVLKIHHPEQSRAQLEDRVDEMMELVGIPAKRKTEYPHQFSGGMKQRLGIAQAELNDPDILILDEPTAGLDPKERVRFRNIISDFAKDKIVILSTHIVSDVSYISDIILMMKQGKILLQGPMETITNSIQGKVWEIMVDERKAAQYSRNLHVVNLHHEGNLVRLRIVDDAAPAPDASIVEPSLEDLFLYHFSEDAQDERSGDDENLD